MVDNTRALTTATEKPGHLHYLLDFRVEPCAQFKQHQCQQHRPYTCFNWHFANQRRRRPVRREDGSFNYSADVYCDKYDENTGICPDGDSCEFLHRVAGDVERKYHPRYYKTALCVHPTDARGLCSKNGAHCAFAHSAQDLRQPLHDAMEPLDGSLLDPENRDKTSFVIEDPLWHDQVHVLSCYKTEQCRKPARLCRQGYACPFYHNSKDRRRPPALYKYRSTPCPAAKSGDEWLEPEQCENGSECGYCHTRTEQQFHPEIYKSTKCNDMLEHGYCPRAVFCAFAHHDSELHVQRIPYYRSSENPSAPISMLPGSLTDTNSSPGSRADSSCTNLSSNFSAGATPTYSAVLKHRQSISKNTPDELQMSSSYFKAPGFEKAQMSPQRISDPAASRMRTNSLTMGQLDLGFSVTGESLVSSLPSYSAFNSVPRNIVDNSLRGLPNAIDEISLDDLSNSALSPITEVKEHKLFNDVFGSSGIPSATSPLQIPGPNSPFGPSSVTSVGDSLFAHHKISNDSAVSVGDFVGSASSLSLFQDGPPTDFTSLQTEYMSREELQKQLRKKSEELLAHHQKLAAWEEGLKQARQACEAWRKDAENYRRLAELAETEKSKAILEKEQALVQLELLKRELRMSNSGGSQSPFEIPSFTSITSFSPFSPLEVSDQNVDGPVCARCGREKRSDVRNPSCPLCCS